jgi:HPt (histidine-containing phosphotransfer) domain-containing protein
VKEFTTGWPKKEDDLNRFYSGMKWNDYEILIHSIKSSSKMIGLNDLSEMARNLEQAAKSQNGDFIAGHHQKFTEDGDRITEKLEGIICDP